MGARPAAIVSGRIWAPARNGETIAQLAAPPQDNLAARRIPGGRPLIQLHASTQLAGARTPHQLDPASRLPCARLIDCMAARAPAHLTNDLVSKLGARKLARGPPNERAAGWRPGAGVVVFPDTFGALGARKRVLNWAGRSAGPEARGRHLARAHAGPVGGAAAAGGPEVGRWAGRESVACGGEFGNNFRAANSNERAPTAQSHTKWRAACRASGGPARAIRLAPGGQSAARRPPPAGQSDGGGRATWGPAGSRRRHARPKLD